MKLKLFLFMLIISCLSGCASEQGPKKVQTYLDSAEQNFERKNYELADTDFDKALSLTKKTMESRARKQGIST